MQIERYITGPLQTNCYLLTDPPTGQSALIDPGGITPQLIDAVHSHTISAILLTHGHFDHTAGVDQIVAETGASVYIHPGDRDMFDNATLNGSFLMGTELMVATEPLLITPDTMIRIGESTITVIPTPGHSRGGVTYVVDSMALAGDTLFRLSVGRWDLPGGDLNTLMTSVRTLIDTLPPEIAVYPGHGEQTTIGYERDHNEFLGASWR